MANLENLKASVQKSEEKVNKCKATIERHKKQLEKKIQKVNKETGIDLTGKTKEEIDKLREPYRQTEESWLFYEVTGKMDDIKGAEKKLNHAIYIYDGWTDRLNKETEKERFLNNNAPKVIVDFLEDWKEKAYQWHIKRYDDYQAYKKQLDEEVIAYKKEIGIEREWATKEQEKMMKEKELDWKSIQKKKFEFAGTTIQHMDTIYDKEERLNWINNQLENSKKAKMIDLIERIHHVVGSITDASYLAIRGGNLNGYIIGEKGKAEVETIGAGGWNIQCFHYRTLIKPMK